MRNIKLDYYIFVEELNEKTIKNIISLKKQKLRVNIVILDKNSLTISKFAKKERISSSSSEALMTYCMRGY